jgi:solute:Na+ symporter, SSS family
MNVYFWLAFALYFFTIFFIGAYVRKAKPSASDMLMGSRGLNFWVTALSAQAADMSSWLFMAFPMSLFVGGLPQIWIAVSLLIGMFANWHFIAPKIRTETEKYNAYTLPSYFNKRFSDHKGTLRLIACLISLVFLTYYLAAGMISIGILFEKLFHIDYIVGTAIATAVIISYAFLGGFVSVAWVDLFQAIFLLIAIIIVPLFAFQHIDGWKAIVEVAKDQHISMSFLPGSIREILYPLLGWGLGYFGMPHIISKFMGIKDPKELVKSKYLGIGWECLALAAAALVGLVSIAYFKGGINDPQLIFVQLVTDFFHPFFAGLILCGVLAATISTMDSQIIVSASLVTEDLYKGMLSHRLSSQHEVKVFRGSVFVISLLAFWIASFRSKTIMDTVYYAWAGLGSLSPLIVASLYSRSVTKEGAIAGLVTSGAIAAFWAPLNIPGGIPAMIPSFFIGLAVIFGVSHCTKVHEHHVG